MESTLRIWKTNRTLYGKLAARFSDEQLNQIPDGYKNNIIWNIGHVIVVQQNLLYGLSGLKPHYPKEMYELYRPGSAPQGDISEGEINTIKDLMVSLIDKTEEDLRNEVFQDFRAYTTGTGFQLDSFAEAFEFNNYHEAIHLGYVMAMSKHLQRGA